MATSAQLNIPKDKFLLIAINLLHRHFIAAARAPAKRLYREIREGRRVPITSVQMEDDSRVRFTLSLDHSEYSGHLHFSSFRQGVSTLLANISVALEEKREISVFNREQSPGSLLFGITGVTMDGENPRVMELGADLEGPDGAITLRLMYLNPDQFARQENADSIDAGAAPV